MTAVSVDPRLRARRVAVAREAGRKRLKRLVAVASVMLVVLLAYVVARSPVLDVDEVTYVGLEQTSLDAVFDAAGIDQGTALIGLDRQSAARRIEALPWIDSVSINRSWTGRITIEITERVAVAAVMAAQDEWVLVDTSGRVLTDVVTVAPEIPKISGVAAAGSPGSRLFADANAALLVAELLPSQLDGRVDGIYRDEIGEVWISLKSADRVLLGPDRDIALKVVAMTSVLEELDARGQTLWELDVSVPTLPVVRPLREALLPAQSTPTE
jgi:cell division protein FtsQ